MNLSKNFALEEMMHSDAAIVKGINNSLPEDKKSLYITNALNLCQNVLQPIRNMIGVPMTIISGYRCPELNKEVGGEPDSQHLICEAADFTVAGLDLKSVFEKIFNKIQEDGSFEIDQCIYEMRHIHWIHISYSTHHKNRKQFLQGLPVGDKIHYTAIAELKDLV